MIYISPGINLDPKDADPAFEKIADRIRSSGGACDGVTSYDVYINYRTSEVDLANLLYYFLKSRQINAFFYPKCVSSNVADGISRGFAMSRRFLPLMSHAGLERVKNKNRSLADHEQDWVLREYEQAITIKSQLEKTDKIAADNYLIPVFVGRYDAGTETLHKWSYSDLKEDVWPNHLV